MTSVSIKFGLRPVIVVGLLAGPYAGAALAATVTVPGNYPTIQAAITAVPDGTTINVQAGIYRERLTVSGSKSLTVRAIGGDAIVDATGKNGAAVTVSNATGQIVFEGLTFRNGARVHGGGFFIDKSSPSFVNCIFENNTGTTDGGGGALFTSNATFTGCTIRNNSAAHFGGGVLIALGSRPVFTNCDIVTNHSGTGGPGVGNNGAGGGVFSNDSSPTFRASRINGNTSKFASGGIHHQGIYGSPYGPSMLVVEDTEIADNVSSQFPGEPNPSEGGGMHVEDNATATLTRVRVLRNHAGTGGGLNAYRGRYDIVDSVIDANEATAGFGGGVATSANFATPQTPATIVNLTTSLVRNNTAPIGGGIAMVGYSSQKATLSLTGSVVSGNQSQSQGGGILANVTNLTAVNSLIINNTVSGGANPYGGGVLITTKSAATINTTTIAHNAAAGGVNGLGGGIFVNDNSTINMSGSNVYDNTASSRGGGLFVGGGQSGTIQNNIIADNSPAQINEDACSSVTYPNNLITPTTFSGCGTLASRAAGTDTTTKPRFAKFLAVPSAGTSMTVAWSVARATSVTVAGIGTWNSPTNSPTGTVDVTPTSSTTYSLTAAATPQNGGNYPATPAGVTVVQPPPSPPPTGNIVDGDFDGDGAADITVFRPSTGAWYLRGIRTVTWGGGGDIPVAGDYDGDGASDIAVFRPSTGVWYLRGLSTIAWGGAGDIPVVGDYDGDGTSDIALFRPSTGDWYLRGISTVTWGGSGDIPVVGDYDGDGKSDIAVFRPSTGDWYLRGISTVTWGGGGDIPVVGDYDGDGKSDIAVFRPSTGVWYLLGISTATWGGGGDIPVPGDYDGDGKTDIAVFRPSTGAWFIVYSSTMSGVVITWGGNGDIPILKRP